MDDRSSCWILRSSCSCSSFSCSKLTILPSFVSKVCFNLSCSACSYLSLSSNLLIEPVFSMVSFWSWVRRNFILSEYSSWGAANNPKPPAAAALPDKAPSSDSFCFPIPKNPAIRDSVRACFSGLLPSPPSMMAAPRRFVSLYIRYSSISRPIRLPKKLAFLFTGLDSVLAL